MLKVWIALVVLVGVGWSLPDSNIAANKQKNDTAQNQKTTINTLIVNGENDSTHEEKISQQCDSCTQEDHRIQKEIENDTWRISIYNRLGVIFGVVTGAGAIASTLITFFWGDRRQKATLAQSRQELRAYIFPRLDKRGILNVAYPTPEEFAAFGLANKDRPDAYRGAPNSGPQLILDFFNHGKTPAYDAMIFCDMKFIDFRGIKEGERRATINTELDVDVIIKSRISGSPKNVVPPGSATGYQAIMSPDTPITDGQVEALREGVGRAAIYVYGAVIYRDTFNTWWRYDFRMAHTKHLADEPIGITGKIIASQTGNSEHQINPKKLPDWWDDFIKVPGRLST